MKTKILMYVSLLTVVIFCVGHRVNAQAARTYGGDARVDSVADAYNQEQAVKEERRRDSEELSDLKSEKKDTREKAKDAQRVENDASDAARESKIAYRQEKKAQKAREKADKQSKKAAKARTKSNDN